MRQILCNKILPKEFIRDLNVVVSICLEAGPGTRRIPRIILLNSHSRIGSQKVSLRCVSCQTCDYPIVHKTLETRPPRST